jgi:hypothetical protein
MVLFSSEHLIEGNILFDLLTAFSQPTLEYELWEGKIIFYIVYCFYLQYLE